MNHAAASDKNMDHSKTSYLTTDLGSLYQGDCLEIMRDMPANNVDLILTDPPYSNIMKPSHPTAASRPL